jgi:hypothetical protein
MGTTLNDFCWGDMNLSIFSGGTTYAWWQGFLHVNTHALEHQICSTSKIQFTNIRKHICRGKINFSKNKSM